MGIVWVVGRTSLKILFKNKEDLLVVILLFFRSCPHLNCTPKVRFGAASFRGLLCQSGSLGSSMSCNVHCSHELELETASLFVRKYPTDEPCSFSNTRYMLFLTSMLFSWQMVWNCAIASARLMGLTASSLRRSTTHSCISCCSHLHHKYSTGRKPGHQTPPPLQ